MYIQKRAYSYYFRLAIPQRIQAFYGKSEICFSLNTLNRKDAKLKSLEYVQHYLVDFEQKKSLPPPVVSTDLMISNQCTGTCNDGGIGAGGSGISGMTCNADKAADVIEYVFSSVYQKYVDERKPAVNTVREFDTVVRRFTAICGDKDIRLYVKRDPLYYSQKIIRKICFIFIIM